ncbi:hypothetical protein CTAYLR_010802 [Chrysophaeum taylorii]|uniref:Cytochrome b561 domain-containing protein n=1 Tax=Chrysophaeum taylorii TaxID=2483200 RepID=A0AAD7UH15_9STRA|nr:hypothetical protein CTAYLR_010802 [Chrysophaeum taylorii]
MSAPAETSTELSVVFERDGVELECGSTYVAGETLTARISAADGIHYLMELQDGGAFDTTTCDGDEFCDDARCGQGSSATGTADAEGASVVAPTDGSDLSLIAAWAQGFGTVYITEACVLVGDADDPTTAPETSANATTTAPPYAIIRNGTCAGFGMVDILDENTCRAVMNDGYYNTRDQNDNGILDFNEDYPIPTVSGLPPGCWPVEPGTPGFEETEFPFACITPLEDAVGECSDNFPCFCQLPEYEIVTNGTCVSMGYADALEETLCRALMNDGYYSTRDQNDDGVIDAFEDYPIPVVTGLPPGCWPVEPGTEGFESTEFPFACITPLEGAVGDCSDNFPCFCLTGSGETEPARVETMPAEPPVAYAVVTDGTCVSHGMIDILDEDACRAESSSRVLMSRASSDISCVCRAVMNDGYYNTRDQNDNGILDFNEDYPIPTVSGLPPGCWPVEPGTSGFEETEFPFACITPLEDAVGNCSASFPCFCQLPEYEIVTSGTCVSAGYADALEETLCRALMNDGYYSTRDQNDDGVIDAFEDYPIPVVSGLPPGCWPVEPGTEGFESTEFPFACITPLEDAVGNCSDNLPCFCLTTTTTQAVPAPTAAVASPTVGTTCSAFPSDDPDFEHMAELDENVQFYWTVETTGDQDASFYPAIRASVVKVGDGWVSLGFSLDEFMPESDAIISTDGLEPQKYQLTGRSDPEIMDDASQTLVDATTEIVDSNLVASFTKSLAEEGEVEIGASGTDWGYFLYGYGDDSLAYHNTNRGALQLDLAPACDPDATPAPTVAPTVSPAPTLTASCESDDADYDFALPIDGSFTFYWRVLDDGDQPSDFYPALQGRYLLAGGGYASLAASLDTMMIGSDAIVGQDGAIPEKYELTARSDAGVTRRGDNTQTLVDTSCETTTIDGASFLDCRFTKQMAEDGEIEIFAVGATQFVWAYGSGGLAYHGTATRGALSLDLSTCAATAVDLVPVSSRAIRIHGQFMIAAWAYCAPLGVIFARAKHACLRAGFFKTWLYLHMLVQVAALVCTAAGFAKAFDAIKDSNGGLDHLTYRHPKLGVGVMVGAAAQLLMGVLRPHPPQKGEPKSIARWAFEGFHRLIGYGTIVLGVITMLAGIEKAMELDHISAMRPWNTAVVAPVAASVFVLVATTIFIFLTTPKSTPYTDVEKAGNIELEEEKN